VGVGDEEGLFKPSSRGEKPHANLPPISCYNVPRFRSLPNHGGSHGCHTDSYSRVGKDSEG
jgi:hypothetical protein